jgi:CBS domain-containing protein
MVNEQFRLIDLIDDVCVGKDVFFRSVRSAKDVMTSDVKTLTLDDTVGTCLKFMKDNKVRHVPVMDTPAEKEEKPYFVGVVSERDVFRQLSPYVGKVGEKDTDPKALRQPLGQIVTRKPKFVSPDTPIPKMIAIMVDNHVDTVPVLTNGDLVSIVTAEDILKFFVRLDTIRQLCAEAGTEGKVRKKRRLVDLISGGLGEMTATLLSVFQTVQDIMTEQVVCLEEQDNMAKAMEVMQVGKFRHVPIVDGQKRLVGIISDRDILRHLPPSTGRQPSPSQAEVFRSRLFSVDPKDPSLKTPLMRIMTLDVIHVPPTCSFYDAAKMLHEMRVSCLPVLDKEKDIRGIVTTTDVMRTLLAAYELTEKSQGQS